MIEKTPCTQNNSLGRKNICLIRMWDVLEIWTQSDPDPDPDPCWCFTPGTVQSFPAPQQVFFSWEAFCPITTLIPNTWPPAPLLIGPPAPPLLAWRLLGNRRAAEAVGSWQSAEKEGKSRPDDTELWGSSAARSGGGLPCACMVGSARKVTDHVLVNPFVKCWLRWFPHLLGFQCWWTQLERLNFSPFFILSVVQLPFSFLLCFVFRWRVHNDWPFYFSYVILPQSKVKFWIRTVIWLINSDHFYGASSTQMRSQFTLTTSNITRPPCTNSRAGFECELYEVCPFLFFF